jgi:fumarate hydratase subunit alpha
MRVFLADLSKLKSEIYQAVLKMNRELPVDVEAAIEEAEIKAGSLGKQVLNAVCLNLKTAREESFPLCQDTGLVLCYIEISEQVFAPGLEKMITEAVEQAYTDGPFRKSTVLDPLKERKNPGTNMPVMFHYEKVDEPVLRLHFLAKGFGSENCSKSFMLNPTAGREAVLKAVVETMATAGGKPCPPVVLGVGIGGTLDIAARLSKKALRRTLDDHHPDPWYAELEEEMLDEVNKLDIGPGGLGGGITALGVKIEISATHIAGLPVVVTVNCWADRRAQIEAELISKELEA